MCHEDNAFVTLTYNDENVGSGTLIPEHLKNWQKSLRYYTDAKLRFFSVGEYGEKTKRPHYHAAVFGFKGCASLDHKCPCIYCKTLRASWTKGHVLNGTLTKDSAGYIAGYVTKKMTDRNPQEKYERLLKQGKEKIAEEYKTRVVDELDGKHPEFARMSLKPGIGAPVIPTLRNMLWTEYGSELLYDLNDAPDIIKIDGKELALGRYLKNKLRDSLGVSDETKEAKMSLLRQERIEEYLSYRQEIENPLQALSQKEFLIEKHKQKVRDLEKRYSYKKQKGVI
jgi:hypothetical protein